MGKSAIFLGRHLQEGEAYTVCDLFESDAPDDANAAEATKSYRSTLTRQAFEANYLSFHDDLAMLDSLLPELGLLCSWWLIPEPLEPLFTAAEQVAVQAGNAAHSSKVVKE